MIAWRMPSMFPPVERSMTVSAPRWTAVCSFSSSSSTFPVTAELPMLALILHFEATPIAIGSSFFVRCTVLAGMTMRPRATSDRISSGSRSSRRATYCISGVMVPCRAASSCVMGVPVEKAQAAEGFASPRRHDPDRVQRVFSQPRRPAGAPLAMRELYAGADQESIFSDGRRAGRRHNGSQPRRPSMKAAALLPRVRALVADRPSDADLLQAFVARRDEQAFATLVR